MTREIMIYMEIIIYTGDYNLCMTRESGLPHWQTLQKSRACPRTGWIFFFQDAGAGTQILNCQGPSTFTILLYTVTREYFCKFLYEVTVRECFCTFLYKATVECASVRFYVKPLTESACVRFYMSHWRESLERVHLS
jgi:hypothetical protein